MHAPTIPDNAPFSSAQRAWLNGFLAGMIGTADAAPVTASSVQGSPVAETAPDAPASDIDPLDALDDSELPWHDPALPMDDRMAMVADKPLPYQLMGAMAQLDCGACGYLCRSYARAIADGDEKDTGRCVPGGKDTARALKQLLKQRAGSNSHAHLDATTSDAVEVKVNGTPVTDIVPAATPATAPTFDRDHPFPAPLLEARRLNGEGSAKDTRHIALSLEGSSLSYQVGDALGVYPRNCYEQVSALIRLMGYSGGEPVTVKDRPRTLREALLDDVDLSTPTDELYSTLADAATRLADADALRRLIDGEAVEGLVDDPRLIDVAARFASARPQPQAFIAALGALRPRLYSISSSPRVHEGQVHLTVGVVRYVKDGQQHKGIASTYLAERVQPHEPVRVFVQPTHGFALTDDHDAPLIMIGPGTGIAPFRAFLHERQAVGAKGRNWLFFGDQHEATDFLYREELAQFQQVGLLTRLDTAFSRDSDQKVYVQHRMLEHGRVLYDWLEQGGYIYVCGDASRMAGDVDTALHQLIAEHSGRGEGHARSYVAALREAGRYRRDVY